MADSLLHQAIVSDGDPVKTGSTTLTTTTSINFGIRPRQFSMMLWCNAMVSDTQRNVLFSCWWDGTVLYEFGMQSMASWYADLRVFSDSTSRVSIASNNDITITWLLMPTDGEYLWFAWI